MQGLRSAGALAQNVNVPDLIKIKMPGSSFTFCKAGPVDVKR